MKRLDPVTASPTEKEQGITVGIHFIGIPDDCHQAIDALSHIGVACHQVKFCYTGKVA